MNRQNDQKTNSKLIDLNLTIPIFTLNVSSENMPIKSRDYWMKKATLDYILPAKKKTKQSILI